MALKFASNFEGFGDLFGMKITEDNLVGWTKAGLLNAMSGDDRFGQNFIGFVQEKYLKNGRALNVRDERDPNWKKRGWHHYQTFIFYTPRAKGSRKAEVRAGMYGSALKNIAGITTYTGSLNYLAGGAIKEKGYIQHAWRDFKGTSKAKEDLLWMYQKGIEKKAREMEVKVK